MQIYNEWKLLIRARLMLAAVALGILVSFATGLIPNKSEVNVPEIKRYGHPYFWLVISLNEPAEFFIISLIIDIFFWVTVSYIVLFLAVNMLTRLRASILFRNLLLPIAFFFPFGLLMDIIHELGHCVWGTIIGGRLKYLQIAYFILYPSLRVTSEFPAWFSCN